MKFTKMQGIGNDYVYVNCFEEKVEDPSALAIQVSDRHFGIGSDGLILILSLIHIQMCIRDSVDTYHPDRILIEPSGVGKLSDVIKAVQDVQGEIDAELNSFTTVVDVTKCKIYRKNFGEFFSNQIEYAVAVILSRTCLLYTSRCV